MLIHDISLLQLHTVFAVDRSGLVGEDGETHHGVFDVGYLRQIPGMQILCPASQAEMRRMLRHAVLELDGPVAIRYPKGGDQTYCRELWTDMFETDAGVTLATYGTTINAVLDAVHQLLRDGIRCDVIKLDQIQPLHLDEIKQSVQKTGHILVVEETAEHGCVGHDILSVLLQSGIYPKAKLLHLGNGVVPHGDLASLRRLTGVDAEGIYQTAKELLRNET